MKRKPNPARLYWKAYHRGYRKAKQYAFYNYSVNPFKPQSQEWFGFCQGWNDSKKGIS